MDCGACCRQSPRRRARPSDWQPLAHACRHPKSPKSSSSAPPLSPPAPPPCPPPSVVAAAAAWPGAAAGPSAGTAGASEGLLDGAGLGVLLEAAAAALRGGESTAADRGGASPGPVADLGAPSRGGPPASALLAGRRPGLARLAPEPTLRWMVAPSVSDTPPTSFSRASMARAAASVAAASASASVAPASMAAAAPPACRSHRATWSLMASWKAYAMCLSLNPSPTRAVALPRRTRRTK
mmetsp:Transcript_16181/g.61307  ORF Transcript_16181/g.61307 Transcript_16181/m.61307 type:complete len:239 (-) Transcript_16181:485-1201(-)